MRRETSDHIKMIGYIQRPVRPSIDATKHETNHYAVHLATCWIHQKTDLPVGTIYKYFHFLQKNKKHISPKKLHAISSLLLRKINDMQDFNASDYASIYHHIMQGIISY